MVENVSKFLFSKLFIYNLYFIMIMKAIPMKLVVVGDIASQKTAVLSQ